MSTIKISLIVIVCSCKELSSEETDWETKQHYKLVNVVTKTYGRMESGHLTKRVGVEGISESQDSSWEGPDEKPRKTTGA